ncbi:asparagine synthase (glutamine-hydrolyzing) [Synechococcus sp. EJ6-Ellesmere]|uniref:asparagine synthase (glutamine-hydrolyzing) n=1 Tax=Synechococcus sp. EJ6-Ellesmere TaxID=2823734 RepID=UPI0020CB6C63|nr:asparagine synthase (glutamine-hydrolyzing) [Synechococcus sp. EJ6-Ellesmere]MCP9825030.1 asparagine synthase (glutamine-hydrolyzing) [Synechococcus sp. EJ6-Ellesmere]
MCGIAGILAGAPGLHASAASAMGVALAHRGPDDAGLWRSPRGDSAPVTLVHRRLAIQDLSPGGHQPMQSACGRYVLVFNGEIYNQHALRGDLERQGHRFRSSSDTEVLLQLLIRYGTAALQRLQGMFGFCLWDSHEQRAMLARDPYGIKPLYLWQGPGGQLLFASEVRALLASNLIPRQLDATALAGFLASGSVPEPRTLVAGITSMPAGWLGEWQTGRWQIQPHWQPSYAPGLLLNRGDQIALSRQALAASVEAHQLSDVPVGLFLSGGLDSSALLALAGGQRITTLSIGFQESAYDESDRAAAVARYFGSSHVPLQLDAARASELLPAFLAAVDQPSIDGFNTYCVSQLAHEQGLKVVLSGLGGDELFGGYTSFRKIPRLLALHRSLGPSRAAAACWLERSGQHQRLRLAAFLCGPATAAAAHRCLRGIFSPGEAAVLLRHWGLPEDAVSDQAFIEAGNSGCPTQADAIAWLESSRYMGQQLLRDSDTYSMAHGLELRIPFVDSQLFRELAPLPAPTRLARGKKLLQDAVPELRQALPPAAKRGFTFPYGVWFDQPGSLLQPGSADHPLPPLPTGLDLQPWPRRWGLMALRYWLNLHLGQNLIGKI